MKLHNWGISVELLTNCINSILHFVVEKISPLEWMLEQRNRVAAKVSINSIELLQSMAFILCCFSHSGSAGHLLHCFVCILDGKYMKLSGLKGFTLWHANKFNQSHSQQTRINLLQLKQTLTPTISFIGWPMKLKNQFLILFLCSKRVL